VPMDVGGKDRNKPVRPRAGRVSAEENPTTGDYTQGEEKPKTKRPKRRRKAVEEEGTGRGGRVSLLTRWDREEKGPRVLFFFFLFCFFFLF
jgi:hypothetical protein